MTISQTYGKTVNIKIVYKTKIKTKAGILELWRALCAFYFFAWDMVSKAREGSNSSSFKCQDPTFETLFQAKQWKIYYNLGSLIVLANSYMTLLKTE